MEKLELTQDIKLLKNIMKNAKEVKPFDSPKYRKLHDEADQKIEKALNERAIAEITSQFYVANEKHR